MKKTIAAFAFLALLAGCSEGEPPRVNADITTGTKINLDVVAITVVDRSGMPPASSPYNSNNFRPTIANAIRQWVSTKLAAVGSTGEAIIVIRNADLSSQALPYTNDWFKRQQASKYLGRAQVEIDISGREGKGVATAESSRFESLPEKPSILERQNAYYTVLNGLMQDLDHNLDSSIHDHLGNFIVTAPSMDTPAAPVAPSSSPY